MKNTIALAAVILGSGLLYAGITGKALSNVLRMALGQEEIPGLNLPLDGSGIQGTATKGSQMPGPAPEGYEWKLGSGGPETDYLIPWDKATQQPSNKPEIPHDDPGYSMGPNGGRVWNGVGESRVNS